MNKAGKYNNKSEKTWKTTHYVDEKDVFWYNDSVKNLWRDKAMLKKKFDLTAHEESIIGKFEARLEKNGIRISRRVSRYLLEISREELKERAREREDWDLIGQLYNPAPGSRAESMLSSHMRTLYEETNGIIPDEEKEMYL